MLEILKKLYHSLQEIAAIDLIITSIIIVIFAILVTPEPSLASSNAGTGISIGQARHSYSQVVDSKFKVEKGSGFESYTKTITKKYSWQ